MYQIAHKKWSMHVCVGLDQAIRLESLGNYLLWSLQWTTVVLNIVFKCWRWLQFSAIIINA